MEDNQNSGVDLSDYLNSPKKQVSTGKSPQEAAKQKKNKIYIAVIIVCVLGAAALWAYYISGNLSY